ncbi:MAG: cation:proton antiporter [Bacteroidetes bacterium]|nr:cation:proton antiporter [Bacteroidota bacterium]
MTTAIILTLCSLFLLAYIFDLTSAKTKIPSVILLFFLGWAAKEISTLFEIQVPELSKLLPVFGTVGLVLIVLEGALDLEFNASKISLVKKSVIAALIPMVGLGFLLAIIFQHFGHYNFKDSLVNAIPLCIISSAIAIPSVKNISRRDKEFVIYESSLSDIFGVIFFNFFALNETINFTSFAHFGIQFLVICLVSFIATLGLAFLLSRISHHIRFVPIIILIIFIYELAKMLNLPALVFILFLGLFLANLDELKDISWISKLKPVEFNKDIQKFKEIVIEGTFLIRTLFFLLFGYLIDSKEILNTASLSWALVIVTLIVVFRFLQLRLIKMPLRPLLLIAPRGLVTILLFITIIPTDKIAIVNKSLIIQVIIITSLMMMVGLITNKKSRKTGN